ncbi:hypothetical protein ZWY2020_046138 [Hordeum vulgare]|nr:hypothetical protein ZWY2020_046138 [Hordeum vulgare]
MPTHNIPRPAAHNPHPPLFPGPIFCPGSLLSCSIDLHGDGALGRHDSHDRRAGQDQRTGSGTLTVLGW